MTGEMADSGRKTAPQRVNTDLFASPGSSSGLSLAFEDTIASPFSLVAPNKESQGQATLTAKSATPSHSLSSSQRSSPVPGGTSDSAQVKNSDNPSAELSTVPLDSPTTTSSRSDFVNASSDPIVSRSTTDSALLNSAKQGARKYEYGWNDPPSVLNPGGTPHRPHVGRAATTPGYGNSADIQIQPHLAPSSTNESGSAQEGPPVPPASEGGMGSNPYRIGSGVASRKPTYGVSGIASFGSTPSTSGTFLSQPSQQVMVPSQLPGFQEDGTVQDVPTSTGLPPTSADLPPSLSSSSSQPYRMSNVWSEQGSGRLAPLMHHWFYLRSQENYWIPFSLTDSALLENAVMSHQDLSQPVLVPTDGGRYDVDLSSRQRRAVYWEEPASQVRRCSWFYKGETDRWYLPYDEVTSQLLEEKYQAGFSQSSWNCKVELGGGECVIMHSFSSIVHYPYSPGSPSLDLEGTGAHPKAVMRGFAELSKVETGEQTRVDHLVFVVHGIGAHYDLSFRSLVDCVDDFREVSQLMLKTHQFTHQAAREGDNGGRVEFLPVHWHSKLHTTGVDDRLKPLTLPSISRLRDFTNSTLLDILYFTSPLFCQTIVSEVTSEMNRMYEIFRRRNPSFEGSVSVVGHSLGSVILFDLLCHQQREPGPTQDSTSAPNAGVEREGEDVAEEERGEDEPDAISIETVLTQLNLESLLQVFQKEQIDYDTLLMCSIEDLKELGLNMGPRKKLSSFITQENERLKLQAEHNSKRAAEKSEREQAVEGEAEAVDSGQLLGVEIVKGFAGTGQTRVQYPQLLFHPQHLFAVGSPIGLFLTVRGVEDLGPSFSLPTCGSVFNIFHPFDPVAYRIEPLITEQAPKLPVLMPHHKGRKRFHLELYENLGYVGASIKQHLVEGMRNMWQQLNDLARSHTNATSDQQEPATIDTEPSGSSYTEVDSIISEEAMPIGMLNSGRRIDHVLQEKPIEKLNEYLFALSSHLCYWHSEDTALFLLKQVYQEPNPLLIKP